MDYAFEQKVRERAYEIWQSAGMSDGLAEEHWFTAERSVMSEKPKAARAKVAKAAVTTATKKETVAKSKTTAKSSAKASAKSPAKSPAKPRARSASTSAAPTIN